MKLRSRQFMKNILGLLLFVGISPQALAIRLQEIPQLLKQPREYVLAHPEFMQARLNEMLTSRCAFYTAATQETCHRAARDFSQDLEIKAIMLTDSNTKKSAKYIVTFTEQLVQLRQDPRTLLLLEDLNRQMDQAEKRMQMFQFISPQSIEPLDLGVVAYRYYGSKPAALRALAVLLQDLPKSEIQVQFLFQKYGADRFTLLLHQTINRLMGLEIPEKGTAMTVFGQRLYNARIYHTLVPGYMAAKLKARGYDDEVSFMIPFLFNYVYEASEVSGNFRAYFFEPGAIASVDTQNDIRAGELGALLGIGRPGLTIGEKEARELIRTAPKKFMRRLLDTVSPVVEPTYQYKFESY
jgi:hypothetical protein